MAAVTKVPNSFHQYMVDGTTDIDTDIIQCSLITWDTEFAASTTGWVGNTAKNVGDMVIPSGGDNGHVYYCTVAGTTATTPEPSWPKDGSTINDGTVTWVDAGANVDPTQTVWIESAAIWAAIHNYSVDDLVRPTGPNANGHYYKCTSDAGSSAGSEPTWPTGAGSTVVDDGITWTEQGINFAANEVVGSAYTDKGITLTNTAMSYSGITSKFDADNVTWNASTITARIAVLWKDGTANGIVNPLILMVLLDDAPADVLSSNSSFSVIWHIDGILNWAPKWSC